MSIAGPVVTCWACNVLIQVPCIDQRPTDVFKCGWCGGINKLDQEQLYEHHDQHGAPSQRWQLYPPKQPPLQPPLADGSRDKRDCIQLHSSQADAEGQHACQLQWQDQHHWQQQHHVNQQMQHIQHGQHIPQQADQQPQLHGSRHAIVMQSDTQPQNAGQVLPGQQPYISIEHPQMQWTTPCKSSKPYKKYSDYGRAFRRTVQLCWGWIIVGFVALIISSVAGTGVIMLLPRLCTTWSTYLPNLAVATVLLTNVVVNYAASVLQSPGRVADWVVPPARGPSGEVLQGSYELYSFCEHCRTAKPPVAHHCRTCGTCVVDMDHHCPFINNCVGRGNLRPFLLFLFWTLLAAVYMLAMCSILVYRNWDTVRSSIGSSMLSRYSFNSDEEHASSVPGSDVDSNGSVVNSSGSVGSWSQVVPAAQSAARPADSVISNWMIVVTGYGAIVLQTAPGWLLAAYYLVAASMALLLALGILLWSQLRYLSKGVTYIQHLKGQAGYHDTDRCSQLGQPGSTAAAAGTAGVQKRWLALRIQLQRVLGLSSDDSWRRLIHMLAVPRWNNPGATGCTADKKWT